MIIKVFFSVSGKENIHSDSYSLVKIDIGNSKHIELLVKQVDKIIFFPKNVIINFNTKRENWTYEIPSVENKFQNKKNIIKWSFIVKCSSFMHLE